MHWTTIPIHIIDFEGTKGSGILEYGIVTLHQNQIIQTYTRLCHATGTILPQDSRLHGILMDNTQNTCPFSDEWPLFSSLRSTGVFAAHHAQTENMLLKNMWPYPRKSPDFLEPDKYSTSWGPWIDSCVLFKTFFPQLESYNLINLINIFKLSEKLTHLTQKYCQPPRNKPHCALYDALASTILLQYLTSLQQFDKATINWLLINSASQTKRRSLEQTTF